MNNPRRFSNSFRSRYSKLVAGKPCDLKRHYLGVMREIIGELDRLANKRPDRFVFCGLKYLVKHCHRFKQPENKYGKRLIEYALKEFRARHIISKRLVRLVGGAEREGFIVTPHDCLCLRESESVCVLAGYMNANARWSRDIIVKDESGKPLAEPRIGPIYWAGYSSAAPGPQPCAAECAESCADTCAVECADTCAVQCADGCAVKCADTTSGQADDSTKVKPEISRLAVGTGVSRVLAVVTEQAEQTPASQPAVLPKNKAGRQAGAFLKYGQALNTTCKAPSEVEIRWQKFLEEAGDALPKEMRYAVPPPADRDAVLKQLAEIPESEIKHCTRAEYLADEIEEWACKRSPPIAHRDYGRWSCWLKEGIWPCW